jgi:hypothetical protein
MKEKLSITIKDLDDMENVLKSLELLFSKLIMYYGNKDLSNLNVLVLSISSYFGKILKMLGYTEDDFRGIDEN